MRDNASANRAALCRVAAGTALWHAMLVETLVEMGVFFFIGGVTVVAGGSLAALYYLVGPSSGDGRNEPKHRPAKKHQLSHWR
jgi:hypothetical protein